MSKKKNGPEKEHFTPADYYKLNTKAVDDLVTANKENSPVVPEEEIRKYTSGPKIKLAEWLKFLLIKWWFIAASCFFFMWGLGNYYADMLDELVATGIAIGLVTDLLTNNALRFLEKVPGGSSRFMMFPKKGYASFFLNILYAFAVLFMVFMTYSVINATIIDITQTETMPLSVEPILFGLFYVAFDELFIEMKMLFKRIVRDARRPAR